MILCKSSSPLFLAGIEKLYIGVQAVQLDVSDTYELRVEDAGSACDANGNVNENQSPSALENVSKRKGNACRRERKTFSFFF